MRYGVSLAALSVAIAGSAAAQTPADPAQPPAADRTTPAPPTESAAQQAVTAYPTSFFAAARPNTAYDMVLRLPGFSFEGGSSVRGFSGSAGNVLIDGERPLTKTETL